MGFAIPREHRHLWHKLEASEPGPLGIEGPKAQTEEYAQGGEAIPDSVSNYRIYFILKAKDKID